MSPVGKRRFATCLEVGAVALIAAGIGTWWHVHSRWGELERLRKENFLEIQADLGNAGEYRGHLRGLQHFAHDTILAVETDGLASTDSILMALEEIEGSWKAVGEEGKVWLDEQFVPFSGGCYVWNERRVFPVMELHGFPDGDSEVALRVTKAAPELASPEYEVVGRYAFCGLEYMGVQLLLLIGGVLLGLAAVLGISAHRLRRSALRMEREGGGS